MNAENALETLREVLHSAPSKDGWLALCRCFDEMPGEVLEVGLEYAQKHLEHWDDRLRAAPEGWVDDVLGGKEQPRLGLTRVLTLNEAQWLHGGFADVLTRPELRHTTGVDVCVDYGSLGTGYRHLKVNVGFIEPLQGAPWASNLTHVGLTGCDLGWGAAAEGVLRALLGFPALASLKLRACRLNALLSVLGQSAGLAGLKCLDVSKNEISRDGLRHLMASKHLGNLRALDLSANPIYGADIAWGRAKTFPDLQALYMSWCPLGKTGVAKLARAKVLKNLVTLDLDSCRLDSKSGAVAAVAQSKMWTKLEHLRLGDVAYSGRKELDALAASACFANLKSLSIHRGLYMDRDLGAFAQSEAFPVLEHLDMSDHRLTWKGVEAIVNGPAMPELKTLIVKKNFFGEEAYSGQNLQFRRDSGSSDPVVLPDALAQARCTIIYE